jgi:hypothetical protein
VSDHASGTTGRFDGRQRGRQAAGEGSTSRRIDAPTLIDRAAGEHHVETALAESDGDTASYAPTGAGDERNRGFSRSHRAHRVAH